MTSTSYFNPYKQFNGAWVPLWLLERREISAQAKLLYAELCKVAGKDADCRPSQEYLSENMGISKRTLQRALTELKNFQLIEAIQRGLNKPNRYFFIQHEWMQHRVTSSSEDLPLKEDIKKEQTPPPSPTEFDNQSPKISAIWDLWGGERAVFLRPPVSLLAGSGDIGYLAELRIKSNFNIDEIGFKMGQFLKRTDDYAKNKRWPMWLLVKSYEEIPVEGEAVESNKAEWEEHLE